MKVCGSRTEGVNSLRSKTRQTERILCQGESVAVTRATRIARRMKVRIEDGQE
jgi:hypothetical protein